MSLILVVSCLLLSSLRVLSTPANVKEIQDQKLMAESSDSSEGEAKRDHCNKTVDIYEDVSSPEVGPETWGRPMTCWYRFRSFRGTPRDWILRIRFKKFKVGTLVNATHCHGGYMQLFVLALLVSAVSAAPQLLARAPLALSGPALAVAHHPVAVAPGDEYDPNPAYDFSYSVNDALTGDSKSQSESRQGDNVQGSYSLLEADGSRRTVEYTADPVNGFNAVVHREAVGAPVRAALVAHQPIAVAHQPIAVAHQPLAIAHL